MCATVSRDSVQSPTRQPKPRRRPRRLAAGVPGADHDHVEVIGIWQISRFGDLAISPSRCPAENISLKIHRRDAEDAENNGGIGEI